MTISCLSACQGFIYPIPAPHPHHIIRRRVAALHAYPLGHANSCTALGIQCLSAQFACSTMHGSCVHSPPRTVYSCPDCIVKTRHRMHHHPSTDVVPTSCRVLSPPHLEHSTPFLPSPLAASERTGPRPPGPSVQTALRALHCIMPDNAVSHTCTTGLRQTAGSTHIVPTPRQPTTRHASYPPARRHPR